MSDRAEAATLQTQEGARPWFGGMIEPSDGKWQPSYDPKIMVALGASEYQAREWAKLPEDLKIHSMFECMCLAQVAGRA